MSKTVILLCGVAQSGKSTIATMLNGIFKGEVNEVALANKLKKVCSERFDLPLETFSDQRYKEIPFSIFNFPVVLYHSIFRDILDDFNIKPTVDGKELTHKEIYELWERDYNYYEFTSARHIAQFVGTELLRKFGGPDIHCQNVELKDGINVITDCRFSNEFDYFTNIEDMVVVPIYLDRKVAESRVNENSHQSEKEVFLFRHKCDQLDNNKSLLETRLDLENILRYHTLID